VNHRPHAERSRSSGAPSKGAIVAFTHSLARALAKRRVRVSAAAPGPIWTPLIPAAFPVDKVQEFGSEVPLGRPGEPDEVAPCYVSWPATTPPS
jgi:NAD(P)-dependent dehydrogenase (short-subunit alcohol dehydrogenase family)